ncbi:type II toxin-antitoxin system VapC family toxin [Neomoorella mulderi]|uniref:tRNA(FMet)-specific endonuclease VapC n=1 Tax=Moorella mulderi DSM 14980 TaxID=1122241 RepID=A0A151ATT9_9FIRM|nr:type II toxin-antitoxin system VapC family toxin [Moorella mulderi]KYH30817.1 tRNA(fMet)-specific endonuclease VapC [Moorella mulderi DSM 14980]
MGDQKTNHIKNYVLDSYALLCYLKDEHGAEIVKELLYEAKDGTVNLYLSWINLGETYYIIQREKGKELAAAAVDLIMAWPVRLSEPSAKQVLAAGDIKAKYPISYADAFAVSLARELNAYLVSGDPEFDVLPEEVIKIKPLPRKKETH